MIKLLLYLYLTKNSFQQIAKKQPLKSQSVSYPLYGDIKHTAYWFTDLHVGYPTPQRQSLIIDTGSSVTAFPCNDCNTLCGSHLDIHFDHEISNTVKPIGCSDNCLLCSRPKLFNDKQKDSFCAYHVLYTEGSAILGRWFTDHLWMNYNIPGNNSDSLFTPIPFGCHHIETHLFFDQNASGILGLEPDSRYGPPTFIASVLSYLLDKFGTEPINIMESKPIRSMKLDHIDSSEIIQPEFSLCFSSSGGIFTIGEPNSIYHLKQESSFERSVNTEVAENSSDTGFLFKTFDLMSVVESFEFFSAKDINKVGINNNIENSTRGIFKFSKFLVDNINGNNSFHQNEKVSTTDRVKELPFKSWSEDRHLQSSVLFNDTFSREQADIDKVKQRVYYQSMKIKGNGLYPLTSNNIQWTPMIASVNKEGRYDSYYVLIKEIYIKSLITEETHIKLPIIKIPPLGLESPWQPYSNFGHGAIALIDSGTTMSKLPFLIYSAIWNAIMESIARRSRNLDSNMHNPDLNNKIYRVSGQPLNSMKSRLLRYIKKLEKKNSSSSHHKLNKRSTKDEDFDHVNNTLYLDSVIDYAKKNFKILEWLEKDHDISKIMKDRLLNKTDTPVYRSLETQNDNSSTVIDDAMKRQLQQFRRTSVIPVFNNTLECWELTNPETDLKYFPEIKIRFHSNADYIWRPSSYLYKKSSQNIFCMTIQPPFEDLSLTDDIISKRSIYESRARNLNRELDIDSEETLLGSSFFINKDIVFHLGQWKLGFIEADCPKTDLVKRLKS